MGVKCQILINKPRAGVYQAGNLVTGAVKYSVDEPTEYRDVTLSFLGEGQCHWTKTYGKVTYDYFGFEEYVNQHVDITDKKPEEKITLHGVYEYPFEFYLPENIPMSYKDNGAPTTASIVYSIQLKFVKASFFSSKKVFTAEIPVYGFVDWKTSDDVSAADVPVTFGLKKSLFAPFSAEKPVVKLKAEIAKACLTPGENAHLSYVVTNNTDVTITSVQAVLYCYITYTADCGNTKKWQLKMKNCKVEMPGVPGREEGDFTCVVPLLPELYSIHNSKVIAREYRVRVTVQLPMPYENAFVEVPIVIGVRKGSEETCLEAADGGSQPPTYWEVMSETNEEEKGKEKK